LHDILALISKTAPNIPLWFYHFPDMTGVLTGQAYTLLELAEQTGKIPTLMGIKYTDENLMDFQSCLAIGNGKYNMLFGRDEEAIAGMLVGAAAAASSTMQYSPTLRTAIELFQKGDLAGAVKYQHLNAQLCEMFGKYGTEHKNVQKAIIRMAGLNVGPSRLPYLDLSDEEYTSLEKDLHKLGFLDSAKPSVVV
jgi:N-acetylneuraminate lyase